MSFHFVAVGRAGEATPIVAMLAAKPEILKTEGKPREDTGDLVKMIHGQHRFISEVVEPL